MKDKRVAFILSNLAQGGSERQMVNLSKALADKGIQVDVVTYYSADFYDIAGNAKNVNYCPIECSGKWDRIKQIRRYYKKANPDIIITLVDRPAVYALLAALGMKEKFILTWRNSNISVFKSLTGRIIRFFRSKIKSIVCNSLNGKNLWIENNPADSQKVTVIYNLINQLSISCNGEKERKINKRTIMIAARVVPDKNAEGLIHAVKGLSYEDRSILQINWYGNPDDSKQYYNQMLSLRDQYGLSNVIAFNGPVTNVSELMLQSDAVGLFSHKEGFPNAICEGLQAGKPIIMTPVSDYKIMVQGNGFLCKSDMAEDIKDALISLLHTDSEKITLMGLESRKIFDNNFDNEANIKKWLFEIEK